MCPDYQHKVWLQYYDYIKRSMCHHSYNHSLSFQKCNGKKMYGTLKAGHNNFASQKFHILKLASLLNGLQ